MTTLTNTAESGLASGTDVTTANSATPDAFALVSPGAGGTIKFSNAHVMRGSLAYEFVAASGVACYAHWTGVAGASTATAARFYLYLTGLPTVSGTVLGIRSSGGGTGILELILTTTGTLQVLSDVTAAVVGTTTGTLSLNTWYRVELGMTNSSATTGTATLRVYLGDSTTPISSMSLDLTAANFGTSVLGTYRFGRSSTTGGTFPAFYVDDMAAATGSATLLGASAPPPPTPPTPVPNNAATYLLDYRGSTPSMGGSLSFSIVQTSGTATTPTVLASGLWSVPQSSTEDLVYTVTVSETGGTTATDTATVPKLAATSSTTVSPLHWNGTAWE